MDCQLKVDQKAGYLHFIVTGKNSRENVAGYLQDIARECEARRCYRILIEERLVGPRLGTMDVFDIVKEGSGRLFGLLKSMAYVDVNAKGDLMHFAETLAVNRALPARVFPTVAEAEAWLAAGAARGKPQPDGGI